MPAMSHDEYLRFLAERARTMKVAMARTVGTPHITPIWFELDGESIVSTTWHKSARAKHLRRDPRVALCVDHETPPFAFAAVEGTATLSEDPDALRHWAARIGGKYMGADRAEEYGRRNGVPGELLVRVVRVTPTRIVAEKGAAD